MGWNDHMETREMHCLDCDETDDWEFWDEVGQDRYVGEVGRVLGVDATKHAKCPHCGSTNGEPTEEDEEDNWSDKNEDDL